MCQSILLLREVLLQVAVAHLKLARLETGGEECVAEAALLSERRKEVCAMELWTCQSRVRRVVDISVQ